MTNFLDLLINELASRGVDVYLDGGQVVLALPDPLPEDVRPLLRQLKTADREALRDFLRRRGLFPYPINETLGIGDVDPLDYRYRDGGLTYEPGWWRKVPKAAGIH
ncbi:MAG: hypothetical protein QME76_09290 [Bacillota bacterium]|nr:hypothetical protein [Bacillota bacterium]